jgi:hypothetical protein
MNAGTIADRLIDATRGAWLRLQAIACDRAIDEAHRQGAVDSEMLREYARQRDAHWAELARIETRRALRRLSAGRAR